MMDRQDNLAWAEVIKYPKTDKKTSTKSDVRIGCLFEKSLLANDSWQGGIAKHYSYTV